MTLTATRLLFSLLLAASVSTFAQNLEVPDTPEVLHQVPAPSERFPAKWYPSIGDGTEVSIAPVTNRPYTATIKTVTTTQTPSGEPLRSVQNGFQARDSVGRTRRESINGGINIDGHSIQTKIVIVVDPVSHCQFNWTEMAGSTLMPADMRLACVICGPQTIRFKDLHLFEGLLGTTLDGTTTRGDTVTTTEHLPSVQIDGVAVDRMRVSNTSRDEQGREKKWSTETWYSPDLKEVIRIGSEADGYEGLTNIRRVDPDPGLFYPPDGWKIEAQRGTAAPNT